MVSTSRRTAADGPSHDRYAVTHGPTELRSNWLIAIRRYRVATAVGHLLWETAQLPLYTLWRTGTPGAIGEAVLHCTLGDLLIGTIALIAALAAFGSPAWPDETLPWLGTGLAPLAQWVVVPTIAFVLVRRGAHQ